MAAPLPNAQHAMQAKLKRLAFALANYVCSTISDDEKGIAQIYNVRLKNTANFLQ